MPWKMSWKNHDEECANWLILELQLKEQNPKLESMWKFEPERLFQEFLLLVNGQRKSQSQLKIKVNSQGQKLARSGLVPGCSGWVTYWAVETLMSSYFAYVALHAKASMANDVLCVTSQITWQWHQQKRVWHMHICTSMWWQVKNLDGSWERVL